MAEMVNFQLRLGVPHGDEFLGLALKVRVTTLHVVLGGAIAAGVLYLVNEMVRIERAAPPRPVEGEQPTPITRGA
jgi:hypothetical protein